MQRSVFFKTPQFFVSILGLVLLAVSGIGFVAKDRTAPPPAGNGPGTELKVRAGDGARPAPALNQLQGAQSLQGQAPVQLQRPPAAEQLQPNAERSTFPDQENVQ